MEIDTIKIVASNSPISRKAHQGEKLSSKKCRLEAIIKGQEWKTLNILLEILKSSSIAVSLSEESSDFLRDVLIGADEVEFLALMRITSFRGHREKVLGSLDQHLGLEARGKERWRKSLNPFREWM